MIKTCQIGIREIEKIASKSYGNNEMEHYYFTNAVWMLVSDKLGITRHVDLDELSQNIFSIKSKNNT